MRRLWLVGAACAIVLSPLACGSEDSGSVEHHDAGSDGKGGTDAKKPDADSATDSKLEAGGVGGTGGTTEGGTDATADVPVDAGPTFVTLAVCGDIAQAGTDGSGIAWTDYARDNAAIVSAHSPAVDYLLAVGDISRYGGPGSGMTLLEHFNTYYKPADRANWGQFDPITFPAPGNHEYFELDSSGTPDAHGYFQYYATRFGTIKARPDTTDTPTRSAKVITASTSTAGTS